MGIVIITINPSSQQLYDQQCLTVKEGDGGMGFQVVVRWLLLLLLLLILLLLYPCSLSRSKFRYHVMTVD